MSQFLQGTKGGSTDVYSYRFDPGRWPGRASGWIQRFRDRESVDRQIGGGEGGMDRDRDPETGREREVYRGGCRRHWIGRHLGWSIGRTERKKVALSSVFLSSNLLLYFIYFIISSTFNATKQNINQDSNRLKITNGNQACIPLNNTLNCSFSNCRHLGRPIGRTERKKVAPSSVFVPFLKSPPIL